MVAGFIKPRNSSLARTHLKNALRAEINQPPVRLIPLLFPLPQGEGKGEGSNTFQAYDLNPLILAFSRREKGPTPLFLSKVGFNFEIGSKTHTHLDLPLKGREKI